MPYSNIVFVKLFLSLFEEDDRFLYQLNESQQLLYIKMLYMAGATNNKITKNTKFICNKINYHHEESCFLSDINRIKTVFPQFIETDGFYSFNKFEQLHNFVGKSKGTPLELQRIVPEKSKSKRRVRDTVCATPTASHTISPNGVLEKIRIAAQARGVDWDDEMRKMDIWLAKNHNRKKTDSFIANWMQRADVCVASTQARRLVS